MCGRFTLIQIIGLELRFMAVFEYEDVLRLDADTPAAFTEPRYNIAPTQQTLAVVNQSGARVIKPMRWGLIPSWAKQGQKLPLNINARDDSLVTAGSWKTPFRRMRCLIPADGFYEWTGPRNNRTPYFIHRKDGELFAFAGIYDVRRDPSNGDTHASCAIVTTKPNALLKTIHDRMPAILDARAEEQWLDPRFTDADGLLALVRPYPPEQMEAYPVGREVNPPGAGGPGLLARVPAQMQLGADDGGPA